MSNFVAMTTGVGRGGICLTAFNSPTPKPPVVCKDVGDIFRKTNYCLFCFKFSLPWQLGLVVV